MVLWSTKKSFHWACVSFKGSVRVKTSGDPAGATPVHLVSVNAPMRSRWDQVIILCVCGGVCVWVVEWVGVCGWVAVFVYVCFCWMCVSDFLCCHTSGFLLPDVTSWNYGCDCLKQASVMYLYVCVSCRSVMGTVSTPHIRRFPHRRLCIMWLASMLRTIWWRQQMTSSGTGELDIQLTCIIFLFHKWLTLP